jgi:hypothetical protein
MSLRDTIGMTLATAGLLLLALGQPLLGPRSYLCGLVLLVTGILLICLAKRRHQASDDGFGDLPANGDGDYLSGSHGADLPDD